MEKFIFKTSIKRILVEAKDVKEAFLKLSKKHRLSFVSVYCEDSGVELTDSEVYGLFGYQVVL